MKTNIENTRDYFTTKCLLTLLFLVLLPMDLLHGQLAGGTYTIGPGIANDYASISDAANALNVQGISGSVEFEIASGTYTEQVVINHVTGSSESNTITFRSESGDSSDVIWQYEPTRLDSNFILRLDGTDYITFHQLSFKILYNTIYGRCVELDGQNYSVTFSNSEFFGLYSIDASPAKIILIADMEQLGDYFQDLSILNNRFHQGSRVLYIEGSGLHDATCYGTVVSGNEFVDDPFTAVYLNRNFAPIVKENTITASGYGINIVADQGGAIVTYNHVVSEHTGIRMVRIGLGGNRALLANNAISVLGKNGNTGINLQGSTQVDIWYNSVYMESMMYDATCIFHAHAVAGSDIRIRNNNLCQINKGYVVNFLDPEFITIMDYNNLYTAGNYIAYWENEEVYDFRGLQTVSGKNTTSLNVYPHYVSRTDLHTTAPWLDNKGVQIPGISEDLDRENRSAEPDIGAYEFSADPAYTTPLAGEYNVGDMNYPDLQTAWADALIKGVSAPVTFNVLEGTYDGRFELVSIPGTNSNNRITIRSHPENTDSVLYRFSDSDLDTNYVIQLHGADFLTLENLCFQTEGVQYAIIMDVWEGVDSLEVLNCGFTGSTGPAPYGYLIFSGDGDFRSRLIEGNRFTGGRYSIYMRRIQNNFTFPRGAVIRGNNLSSHHGGMYIQYYESPIIEENTITVPSYGIEAYSCDAYLQIHKNIIDVESSSGIRLSTCAAVGDERGLITNNFIHVGGASQGYGININNSSNQLIFNNSVHLSNTRYNSAAFYVSSGGTSSLTLFNNIFANTGGGYSYYIANPATMIGSDHNDIFSTGGPLAHWGGEDINDLAGLQTASGMEANSVSAHPMFVSDTDLHTQAAALDSAGQSLAAVPDDIDGESRHEHYPDIGADEFGIIPNQPPYVDKPIPDLEILAEPPGALEVAGLDTVFQDPDPGDVLTYLAESTVPQVTVLISNDVLSLDAEAGYTGIAEIRVLAKDPFNEKAIDTFLVEYYIPDNYPPQALDDTIRTGKGIIIYPLENDSDPDGDKLFISAITRDPSSGSARVLPGDTSILYVPVDFSSPRDTIVYVAGDRKGKEDDAFIFINLYLLQEGFNLVDHGMEAVSHGSARFGDLDGDKDLDVLLTGWLGTGQDRITKVYRYDAPAYTEVKDLQGVSSGTAEGAAWLDFDDNGHMDFSVSGMTHGTSNIRKTFVYSHKPEGFFWMTEPENVDVTAGSMDWGDADNNGRSDLLLTGLDSAGNAFTGIFRHENGGAEGWLLPYVSGMNLPGLWAGEGNWVDFDKDGLQDIFLCGAELDSCHLYRNTAGGFDPVGIGIQKYSNAAADWGDFDGDGDLDLAICGRTELESYHTAIYRNDGPGEGSTWKFTNIQADLEDVESGDLAWADYDEDGDLDLMVAGNFGVIHSSTKLYENLEGLFIPSIFSFTGLGRSSVEWGDYDADGDLDVLLTGYANLPGGPKTLLYKNTRISSNQPPSAPTGLTAEKGDDWINFSWEASTDDHTAAEALTYNIRIERQTDIRMILAPMSLEDGTRMLPADGNVGQKLSWWIGGLEEGNYTWSVQAVDGGYRGSVFAGDQQVFLVSNNPIKTEMHLHAYPNPFNNMTQIGFSLTGSCRVSLDVFDLQGRKIESILNNNLSAGPHVFNWQPGGLPDGIYAVRLVTDEGIGIIRLVYRK